MLKIRRAQPADQDAIWEIFQPIVAKGDTYPFAPDTDRNTAIKLWLETPPATYVAEIDGDVVGTYYLKPNQPGLGAHVCNCGYMVSPRARGRGAATAMCKHSQKAASEAGFLAMQFNLVVSTNEGAVRLWRRLGFEIIGTLPRAFLHMERGYVDAHIMYKWLGVESDSG